MFNVCASLSGEQRREWECKDLTAVKQRTGGVEVVLTLSMPFLCPAGESGLCCLWHMMWQSEYCTLTQRQTHLRLVYDLPCWATCPQESTWESRSEVSAVMWHRMRMPPTGQREWQRRMKEWDFSCGYYKEMLNISNEMCVFIKFIMERITLNIHITWQMKINELIN